MKKLLALLLALCMIAGLMPAALAAEGDPETGSDPRTVPVEEIEPEQKGDVDNTREEPGPSYEPGDEIVAMVELTAPSLLDLYDANLANGQSAGAAVSEYILNAYDSGAADAILDAQESVIAQVRALDPSYADKDLAAQWVIVLNGFAIKVKYGDLEAIRAIDGVKTAYVSQTIAPPETVELDTPMEGTGSAGYSYNLIGLDKAWENGWTGQGMVVAVLDTGLDLSYTSFFLAGEDNNKDDGLHDGDNVTMVRHTHEAFTADSFKSNDPDSFIHYKDEAAIKTVVNSKTDGGKYALHAVADLLSLHNGELAEGADNGFWKNRKVPYAFDYAGTVDPYTGAVQYGDRNVYPTNEGSDHGTHVSGTILGYAKTKEGAVKFSGIAPDAQLMMMKVFDDSGSGASELSFVYALEDALTLGADVINMSYGSDNGYAEDYSTGRSMYEKLEKAGIILMTSAGNSGYSTGNNNYGGYNLTTDPESSMMSSPAVYPSNLAVASVNNTVEAASYFNWSGKDGKTNSAPFNDPNYEAIRYRFTDDYIEQMKDPDAPGIEIIPCGVGNKSDFEAAGFSSVLSGTDHGKTGIALVIRGGVNEETDELLSFADKINNGMEYAWSYNDETGAQHVGGVLAVIVYDSDPNSESLISMSVAGTALTSAFISGKTGAAIANAAKNGGAYLVSVDPEDHISDWADGGLMSSFSSWGAGPSLELKPEITAPGGNIWSTVFDYLYPYSSKTGVYDDYEGGYSMMSGTSMAAPHMTGMATLVREYLRKTYKDTGKVPEGQEDEIANALLVSTAIPIPEDEAYYSPRYQGAGLANVGNAVTSPAYITVEGQLVGKIEFKDDPGWTGKFNSSFKVTNLTDSPLSYSGKIVVMVPDTDKQVNSATPGAAKDVLLYSDRVLTIIDLDTISVPASGSVDVPVNIDISSEVSSLRALYPNGTYVEGYIILEDQADEAPNIGLPFLGYLGDWTTPAIFDAHTWLDVEDNSLWNTENTWGFNFVSFYDGYSFFNMGQNPFDPLSDTVQVIYHPDNIALSPNGTSLSAITAINDFVLYQLRDAKVIVLEARDADTEELYYRDIEPLLPKTVYSGDYGTAVPMSAMYMTENWDGTKMGVMTANGTATGSGEALKNGTNVIFTIMAFGDGDYSNLGTTNMLGRQIPNFWSIDLADENTWPTYNKHPMDTTGDSISFPVFIDTQAPSLVNGSVSVYQDNGHTYITGTVKDNGSLAGVRVVPQVERIHNGVSDGFIIDNNSPFYTQAIYDAALKTFTFTADVTTFVNGNTGWDESYEFKWSGGVVIRAMDYAGNEGTFAAMVDPDGAVSGMSVTPNSALMYVGDSFDFSVIENVPTESLSYESENDNVAIVSETGHVTAVGTGQTVITVTNGDGIKERVVVAVREHIYDVTNFRLSIAKFDNMKPDGVLIIKILDLEPGNVELGTIYSTVSWDAHEDEKTAQEIYSGNVMVSQYTKDAMTGEIGLLYSAGQVLDDDGNPVLDEDGNPVLLNGSGELIVTLGGAEDGSKQGVSRSMEFNWENLYEKISDEDLMSDTSLDGEQTVYVKQGETATLVAKYRGDEAHTFVPVHLYTAEGVTSPSSDNPETAAKGLKLDGPTFAGTDAQWEGRIVADAGYELPDTIRVFTRYNDNGYEVEQTGYLYNTPFTYDKTTGNIVVYHAPYGSESQMIIRADGIAKEGAKGGQLSGKEYKQPDALYGPFEWSMAEAPTGVTNVEGTLKTFENERLNGTLKNGAYFTANGPGVSYIQAATKEKGVDGKPLYTLTFAVVTLPTTATSLDIPEGKEHKLEMKVGDKQTLEAVLDPVPTQETDKKLIWTSYNPTVATVDETTGEVTANATGYAYIGVMAANRDADAGGVLETYYIIHVIDPDNPEKPDVPETVAVTFRDSLDRTVIGTVRVHPGEALGSNIPTPPQHPGYNFIGWDDGNGTSINSSTVITGSITIFARYSAIVVAPSVPSTPSTPEDPVVTTNDVEHDGEVSTETRAKPEATVQGDTATADITEAMGDEMIKQALANDSESVGVIMESSAGVSSYKATFPGSVITDIADKTDAALCMEAPIIDFDIPNEALAELSDCDTLTVTAEKKNGAVTFDILADGKSVGDTVGSLKAKLDLKYGEVAVLVHPDGTETLIPKSAVENGSTYVVLDGCGTVKVINNSKNFEDVHSEWFSSAVSFVSSHELFVGTSPTEFSPNANMTRADLATVLWRLESSVEADGGIDFADVPGNVYYTDAVEWASANHVIEGTAPGIFAPVSNVTRQEMVTMIYRYVQTLGMDTGDTVNLTGFKDSGKVASWAEDAMEWAVANGIIQGKGNDVLAPEATATRAEVATIMERLVEYIVK